MYNIYIYVHGNMYRIFKVFLKQLIIATISGHI